MENVDKKEKNLQNLFDMAMNGDEEVSTPLFSSLKAVKERYKVDSLIASGGMKNIYKVFDNASEKYIALARLHEGADKEQYDAFIREARLTAKLEHPNVIAVYDLGVYDDEPYFTMDLKYGGSLEDILVSHRDENSRKYELKNLLGIFLKVCDAISYAHSREVLHLDLKPSNIQVGDFGEVLVCDWGLGKVVNSNDDTEMDALLFNPDLLNHLTLNGHIKGTPGYMAPEQVTKNQEKTFQTDIYALGAILYSIIIDFSPLEGTTEDKIEKTSKGFFELPSKRFPNKNIPDGLEAIVVKAMKRNPQDRYDSVKELKNDVSKFLSGRAPEAEEAGILKQIKLFYKRNFLVVSLSFLFLFIIFIGLFLFISELKKSRDLAEMQKLTAIQNQQKAEESLRLYLEEKNKLEHISQEWSKDITVHTEPLRYHFFFEAPNKYIKQTIEGLKKALKINPQNERAIGLLGHQYFITQKYKKANEIFDVSHYRQEDIYPISQHFATLKRDDEMLTLPQLAELIERVGKNYSRRHHLSERLLAWHYHNKSGKGDYLEAVKALLKIQNHGYDEFELVYDRETRHLYVEGMGLRSFAEDTRTGSGKCLFRFLNVRRMTVKSDKQLNLKDLNGLNNLEYLDISSAKVKNIHFLASLPKLVVLALSSQQVNFKGVDTLNEAIDIKIKKQIKN